MFAVTTDVRQCDGRLTKYGKRVNLAVDIGNSRIKFGIVDKGCIVDTYCTESFDTSLVERLFSRYSIDSAVAVCSRGPFTALRECIEPLVDNFMMFDSSTPVPLINMYATPQTLGADRLAAAVGARTIYPNDNVLVVDFGTAITFDMVTSAGEYLGGNISPGAMSRFRALHDYTAALPMLSLPDEVERLGNCSDTAIRSGVALGIIYEVEGYISYMSAEYDDLKIIFTGGDANYFAKRLKSAIFATCDLIIYGLNTILEYNAKIQTI